MKAERGLTIREGKMTKYYNELSRMLELRVFRQTAKWSLFLSRKRGLACVSHVLGLWTRRNIELTPQ
jgi:hypothetical protein